MQYILKVPDDVATNGSLRPAAPDMQLPGVIDNVERDADSGDLTMGYIHDPAAQRGGAIVARCHDRRSHTYAPPAITVLDDSAAVSRIRPNSSYQVSTSLVRGRWTLLGSPWDVGPVACIS